MLEPKKHASVDIAFTIDNLLRAELLVQTENPCIASVFTCCDLKKRSGENQTAR